MEKVQLSQAFLRKRRFMLALPLLVVPFLTMAFWALGGGAANQSVTSAKQPGLNLSLPDAGLKEDNRENKLSFYEQAEKNSTRLEELMQNDPYYKKGEDTTYPFANELEQPTQPPATRNSQQLNLSPYEVGAANPEKELVQKLAMLEKNLNKNERKAEDLSKQYPAVQTGGFSGEVDRLEELMQVMNKPGEEDAEIKQLNGTLDKILDIQHPGRVKDRIKEQSVSQKEVLFSVRKHPANENSSLLDTGKRSILTGTGFFGIDEDLTEEKVNSAIEAVVHGNQVVVNGAVIKLRLATDVYINGTLIPKDRFVFGTASLQQERLKVEITSIRYHQSLFPVKLQVYDLDGLPGIFVPGAITRDVAKQTADNSLQLMEVTSLDPSLKAQAAATGITAVKSLLGKKTKQVKIVVKGGYKVLLVNKNQQQ